MEEIFKLLIQSPLGLVQIVGTDKYLTEINFLEDSQESDANVPLILKRCAQQLQQYFFGKRQSFNIALSPSGTAFQKQVWQALTEIQYGKTSSYLDIAKSIDNPKSVRAVGTANGSNPIPIIIPCHRVIGQDGSLTGYSGGIWRKEWLLKHEAKHSNLPLFI